MHGDQPKVMKLLGDDQRRRDGGLGVRQAPGGLLRHRAGGADRRRRARQRQRAGQLRRAHAAVDLADAAQAAADRVARPIRWSRLRTLRDTSLDQLNALAKRDGEQRAEGSSWTRWRRRRRRCAQLADQLATTLNAITADDVKGQALAAAALIAANVTPVVTVHIAFGGDNHTDSNLQAEADQHVSGVAGHPGGR